MVRNDGWCVADDLPLYILPRCQHERNEGEGPGDTLLQDCLQAILGGADIRNYLTTL